MSRRGGFLDRVVADDVGISVSNLLLFAEVFASFVLWETRAMSCGTAGSEGEGLAGVRRVERCGGSSDCGFSSWGASVDGFGSNGGIANVRLKSTSVISRLLWIH